MTASNGTEKPDFRIIIVGGGIAGLCAAIALRAPGREITILEQSSFLQEIGAGISLQPNASKILEKTWNVELETPTCKKIVDQGFRIFSTEGELVKEIPLVKKAEYGADRVIYHRQDLHALLLAAATSPTRPGPPASIRLASRVTAIDCSSGTVTLAPSTSSPPSSSDSNPATTTLTADLVIGADGIRSGVRASVLGNTAASPVPTGLSAYRLMVPVARLADTGFAARIDPAAPFTSMVMGHDRRLVMGPCRGGEAFSVVALVPDACVAGSADGASWRSKAPLRDVREAFAAFPEWVKGGLFRGGEAEGRGGEEEEEEQVGLWQLRDLDPLERWHRGRAVVIGDAAHAMLPTQGQGASQAVEDAEALGAFFEGVGGRVGAEEVERRLVEVVGCRRERATLIQEYSRQAARPATNGKDGKVTLTTAEFMDYNCIYNGAKDFQRRQREGAPVAPVKA